ncbi:hypothetical protein VP01_701g1 [Puccinia sorghi]|uniref:Uncharacterized protein n=1 Tax=Puccinia sorghi TaxID=27349 RepID=A0A0L6UFX6_9BASI|nr:hypothetical protein VP01_701g1 [Puccinia sorghi]
MSHWPPQNQQPMQQNQIRNQIRTNAIINNSQRAAQLNHSPNTPTFTLHSSPPISPQNQLNLINVPSHSLPHPSQNPHPAALADNASILTLASSGFSPSLHHNQNLLLSDEDASVRALAPSRRESVESLSSRWSNVKSTRTGNSIRTTGTGFYTGISNCDSATGAISADQLLSPTAPNNESDDSQPIPTLETSPVHEI